MNQRFTLIVAGSPDQRTGGYLYDAHIVAELRKQGWDIELIGLDGHFPDADSVAQQALESALVQLPDDHQVVIDGLVMGGLPEVIKRHQSRLAITALVHHPLGDERGLSDDEQARFHRLELGGLAAVRQVIVTSAFTQRRLKALAADYQIALPVISVVEPGVTPVADANRLSRPTTSSPLRILCVATLTPRKGQDLLVAALSRLVHLDWQCDCFGSLNRDPAFADRVAGLVDHYALGERFRLPGECDQAQLEAAYQNADLLVLPSWYEGYGMVISEALAHGLPVITTRGGALADTLPEGAGIAVPPGDVEALSAAIERFLQEPALRGSLTQGADAARQQLGSWQDAAEEFAAALAMPAGSRFAADWLALREPLDVQTRSQRLAGFAADWLKTTTQAPRLVDLGCGRGSNLCFLARRWPGPQHWLLVDHDPSLLSQARQRGGIALIVFQHLLIDGLRRRGFARVQRAARLLQGLVDRLLLLLAGVTGHLGELLDELPDVGFLLRALEPVDRPPLIEGVDHGNRLDAQLRRQGLRLVDVELDELDLALLLLDDFLQDRGERLAGPAPRRPEVDDHRLLHRAFDDVGGEVLLAGVLDHVAGRTGVAGLLRLLSLSDNRLHDCARPVVRSSHAASSAARLAPPCLDREMAVPRGRDKSR